MPDTTEPIRRQRNVEINTPGLEVVKPLKPNTGKCGTQKN